MGNSREQNRAVLTGGPVGSTIVRLTFQMTAGILGMVAFNLTDTFFVSRLGTSELAALSFTFAVVLVLTRLAMGIGIGASSVISRAIGVGDWRSVRRITTDSLILSISLVIVLSAVGLTTIRPLFRLLGASDEILPLVARYMKIWYFGLPFVVFPMVSNNAIRATGDMKTPALIMLTAVAVNGVLDPLLIFGIGPFPRMGLEGAATATVIGRAVTFTVSFYVVFRRLGMITFEKPSLAEMIDSWKRILFIGLPSAATRIILPLGIGVVTRIAAEFGPRAVAAIGVSYRV